MLEVSLGPEAGTSFLGAPTATFSLIYINFFRPSVHLFRGPVKKLDIERPRNPFRRVTVKIEGWVMLTNVVPENSGSREKVVTFSRD